MMSKKILVTGGAGFIGSHLCERLLFEGYQVVSLDNFNDFYDPEIKRENIQTIEERFGQEHFKSYEGDIRVQSRLLALLEREKPDGVIHLAAMAGVRPSLKNPELYIDVNIGGTQALLNACVKKKVQHFLFASSSSVYGNNAKTPFSESDSVDFPISPYAATKKAGELICYTAAHLHPIKILCLRFFTVFGPRQRPDLAIHKFSRRIQEGKEITVFGDGETKRDYTYVDDLVDGIILALEYNMGVTGAPRYEIFNLGESKTISLNEMIQHLENFLGRKANIRRLPLQPGDVFSTWADISKAKKILNYSPAMDFEEGIFKFVEWLKRKDLVFVK